MVDNLSHSTIIPMDGKLKHIADVIVKTRKYNIMLKFRVVNQKFFKNTSLDKQSLSLMSQYHFKSMRNLSFLIFYYTLHNQLIIVDIESFLRIKINRIFFEEIAKYGFEMSNWNKVCKYFDIIARFKDSVFSANKGCIHYWLIESPDEAYMRSNNSRRSMGYCKSCGKVRFNFSNIFKGKIEFVNEDYPK